MCEAVSARVWRNGTENSQYWEFLIFLVVYKKIGTGKKSLGTGINHQPRLHLKLNHRVQQFRWQSVQTTSDPCRVEFGHSSRSSSSSSLLLSKTGFRKDSQFAAASLQLCKKHHHKLLTRYFSGKNARNLSRFPFSGWQRKTKAGGLANCSSTPWLTDQCMSASLDVNSAKASMRVKTKLTSEYQSQLFQKSCDCRY